MKKTYGDRVEFLAIYVREAHPTDGWRMESNDRAGVVFSQPTSLTERIGIADKCCQSLQITMPLLVDEIDDRVGRLYSGMPDRLYVIDRHGRIAYKGGRGPFGFKPGEMEQSLNLLLLEEADQKQEPERNQARQAPRFPLLDDEAAWKRLPEVEAAFGKSLPLWARALAASLPRTTAVMLEQDYAYRSSTAFDPKLRAKMRWITANANRCDYSRIYAESDLRRAGATDAEILALREGVSADALGEQAALTFARKMTLEAYKVTDQEVEDLTGYFDEKTVVAMVLQMAFANFQDRLLLALNVPVEPDGPLPPLDVRFVALKPGETVAAAPRAEREETELKEVVTSIKDLDWQSFSFDQLQRQLEEQRARKPRVSVPAWSEVQPLIPPDLFPPDRPTKVRWSLAVLGHQPKLGVLWLRGLRTFAREAKQDRVFEESLFWVVTRSLQCFY